MIPLPPSTRIFLACGATDKSEMTKAIAYWRKRLVALTRFLDDGRLEIDNTISERTMRCVALGRKN